MEIYVARDGRQLGTYSVEEVRQHLATGALTGDDLGWYDGLGDWQTLGSIAGIVTSRGQDFRAPPPPPPPPPPPSAPWRPLAAPFPAQAPNVANKATISTGYACAGISLLFFPPGFGIAGVVIGIIVAARGSGAQGAAIIALSIVCAIIGMCIGAALTS